MFSFFKNKKEDVKFDADVMVTLPKSKKAINLQELLNSTDETMEKNPDGYANPEHKVKLHDGRETSVGKLVALHQCYHNFLKDEGFDEKREAMEAEVLKDDAKGGEHGDGHQTPPPEAKSEVKEVAEKIENETPEEKEAREKKEKEDKDRVENARKKADALRNAGPKTQKFNPDMLQNRVVTTDEGISLGKKLF